MSAHIKGPLQVNQFDADQICDTDGDVRGCAPAAYMQGSNRERGANARRLVACWNACERVTTERLEDLGRPLMDHLFAADAHAAKLHAINKELLDAAKLVLAWYEAESNHAKEPDFYKRVEMCRASEDALRAAIAKAEGQS